MAVAEGRMLKTSASLEFVLWSLNSLSAIEITIVVCVQTIICCVYRQGAGVVLTTVLCVINCKDRTHVSTIVYKYTTCIEI